MAMVDSYKAALKFTKTADEEEGMRFTVTGPSRYIAAFREMKQKEKRKK